MPNDRSEPVIAFRDGLPRLPANLVERTESDQFSKGVHATRPLGGMHSMMESVLGNIDETPSRLTSARDVFLGRQVAPEVATTAFGWRMDRSNTAEQLLTIMSTTAFQELAESINEASGDPIDWDEVGRKILEGPDEIRDFWHDLLWWILFSWNVGAFYTWPKIVTDLIKSVIARRKAYWSELFDHDWSCKEKCEYWKRKADHIVVRKHGGSKAKLGHNERDLKDCLECCEDYRACDEDTRKGSDDFFTWLTGIP